MCEGRAVNARADLGKFRPVLPRRGRARPGGRSLPNRRIPTGEQCFLRPPDVPVGPGAPQLEAEASSAPQKRSGP